jgi:hypothetical protein
MSGCAIDGALFHPDVLKRDRMCRMMLEDDEVRQHG